jgi:hypothetical protein
MLSEFCKKPTPEGRGGKMLEETLLDYAFVSLDTNDYSTFTVAEDRGAVPDYSYRRCEEEVENNARPRAHWAESKGCGKTFYELRVVRATKSS